MDSRTRAWIRSIRDVIDDMLSTGLFEIYPAGVDWREIVDAHDPRLKEKDTVMKDKVK